MVNIKAFMNDGKRKQKVPGWLKRLYYQASLVYRKKEHLEALEGIDSQITQAKKPEEKWKAFTSSNTQLWADIPDAPFVAFIWWLNELKPRIVRRKIIRIDDIPISALPSLSWAKNKLRAFAIGQWNSSSPYEGLMPFHLLAELFLGKHYPIGKIYKTRLHKDSNVFYSGRILSLQTALTWLTSQAIKHNLLKIPQVFFHIAFILNN